MGFEKGGRCLYVVEIGLTGSSNLFFLLPIVEIGWLKYLPIMWFDKVTSFKHSLGGSFKFEIAFRMEGIFRNWQSAPIFLSNWTLSPYDNMPFMVTPCYNDYIFDIDCGFPPVKSQITSSCVAGGVKFFFVLCDSFHSSRAAGRKCLLYPLFV